MGRRGTVRWEGEGVGGRGEGIEMAGRGEGQRSKDKGETECLVAVFSMRGNRGSLWRVACCGGECGELSVGGEVMRGCTPPSVSDLLTSSKA